MIGLRALTWEDMEPIRKERNKLPDGILRTPFVLTYEQQMDWFRNTICDRRSTTRYWALQDGKHLVGYGGIENIEWENGLGEISLLIFEKHRNQGYGKEAAKTFLDRAFNYLRLNCVFGEVYESNIVGLKFWRKLCPHVPSRLKDRKFMDGEFYDSQYFWWRKEDLKGDENEVV